MEYELMTLIDEIEDQSLIAEMAVMDALIDASIKESMMLEYDISDDTIQEGVKMDAFKADVNEAIHGKAGENRAISILKLIPRLIMSLIKAVGRLINDTKNTDAVKRLYKTAMNGGEINDAELMTILRNIDKGVIPNELPTELVDRAIALVKRQEKASFMRNTNSHQMTRPTEETNINPNLAGSYEAIKRGKVLVRFSYDEISNLLSIVDKILTEMNKMLNYIASNPSGEYTIQNRMMVFKNYSKNMTSYIQDMYKSRHHEVDIASLEKGQAAVKQQITAIEQKQATINSMIEKLSNLKHVETQGVKPSSDIIPPITQKALNEMVSCLKECSTIVVNASVDLQRNLESYAACSMIVDYLANPRNKFRNTTSTSRMKRSTPANNPTENVEQPAEPNTASNETPQS